MNFWDTSAFIEAQNPASQSHSRAKGLLLQKTRHAASALIQPEAASALTRNLKPDSAAADAACMLALEALSRFNLYPVDADVIDASVEIARRNALRGADSIHLATALLLARESGRRGFVFITLDREQAAAARQRGLRVVVP